MVHNFPSLIVSFFGLIAFYMEWSLAALFVLTNICSVFLYVLTVLCPVGDMVRYKGGERIRELERGQSGKGHTHTRTHAQIHIQRKFCTQRCSHTEETGPRNRGLQVRRPGSVCSHR